MKRSLPPERAVAVSCIRWLRQVLPAGSKVASIVNEQRGLSPDPMARARFGMARKASGVVTGFPDATAMLPGGRVLWFEWKRPDGGVLSVAQQEIHAEARALGHHVIVATSIETCRAALQEIGLPLREAAGQAVATPTVRSAKRKALPQDAIPF